MQRSNRRKAQRPSEQIAELVQRISRLCPDHRNPHRFHEEKSEITYRLSVIAKEITGQ